MFFIVICYYICFFRARLTIPASLEVLDKADNSVGVVAKVDIVAKSKFGPFEAKRTTHDLYTENCFLLKVKSKMNHVRNH